MTKSITEEITSEAETSLELEGDSSMGTTGVILREGFRDGTKTEVLEYLLDRTEDGILELQSQVSLRVKGTLTKAVTQVLTVSQGRIFRVIKNPDVSSVMASTI